MQSRTGAPRPEPGPPPRYPPPVRHRRCAAGTTRVRQVDPVVVTADRPQTPLITSTAAVSRISGEALRTLPLRSVADALRSVPGITFVDNDGLGFAPQLMVRGFYGGGEADYVVVLIDGRPLNGLQAGLYNWDMIRLSALKSIEVIRRGASSRRHGESRLPKLLRQLRAQPLLREPSAMPGVGRAVPDDLADAVEITDPGWSRRPWRGMAAESIGRIARRWL